MAKVLRSRGSIASGGRGPDLTPAAGRLRRGGPAAALPSRTRCRKGHRRLTFSPAATTRPPAGCILDSPCRELDQSMWSSKRSDLAVPGRAPMSSTGEGSVTRWLGDLKSGGDAAAQHLWDRYFDRLVHLCKVEAPGTGPCRETAALAGRLRRPGADPRAGRHGYRGVRAAPVAARERLAPADPEPELRELSPRRDRSANRPHGQDRRAAAGPICRSWTRPSKSIAIAARIPLGASGSRIVPP